MNRISKTFFSLLVLHLLGAAEKGYTQPSISGISFDNDHILISAKLNQEFKWTQAKFISIKSFPADPHGPLIRIMSFGLEVMMRIQLIGFSMTM